MIRPFLNDMTMSELHAVMTGGFATIAGSVLGAYISFGVSETSSYEYLNYVLREQQRYCSKKQILTGTRSSVVRFD